MKNALLRYARLLLVTVLFLAALGVSIQSALADTSVPPIPKKDISSSKGVFTEMPAPSLAVGQTLISNLFPGTSQAVGISSTLNFASSFTTPATGSYMISSARLNLVEVSVESNVFLWIV